MIPADQEKLTENFNLFLDRVGEQTRLLQDAAYLNGFNRAHRERFDRQTAILQWANATFGAETADITGESAASWKKPSNWRKRLALNRKTSKTWSNTSSPDRPARLPKKSANAASRCWPWPNTSTSTPIMKNARNSSASPHCLPIIGKPGRMPRLIKVWG